MRRSVAYAEATTQRVLQIVAVASIGMWHDLTPEATERALAQITASDKLSPQTRNDYLTAVNMFANWMVKQKRTARNPIVCVNRLEVEQHEHRRALEPDEAAHLFAATEAGEPMRGSPETGRCGWN